MDDANGCATLKRVKRSGRAPRPYGVEGLPPSHKATAGKGSVTVAAQLFLLMLILMLMLILVLVIEEAGQILLPANEAYESANDPTASLYGAASNHE